MEDKITWFVKKGPFADKEYDMGGDYNGYVVVPKDSPYFGKEYDDVDVSIHGGWTFGSCADRLTWEELPEEYRTENYWVFGWDTLHAGDSRGSWPKEKVERLTESAAKKMIRSRGK